MHGNYRALVVDNKDPKGNTGRIKVRVYGMHDGVKESALPWAQYADTTMMGSLRVPDKGSNVWVFFEAGEIDQPIYFACAPAKPDVPNEADTDYPSNRVIKTKAGILIEVNDSEKQVHLNVGDIDIFIDENSCETRIDETSIKVSDKGVDVKSSIKVSVTSPMISLNGL